MPQPPGPSDSQGARAPQGPRTADRTRYLVTHAEHAALAAALWLQRSRWRPAPSPAGRLGVAFVSAFPPNHLGTISRFTRWVRHLAPLGYDVTILTPCSDQTFAAFGRGDARADCRYYHECLVNLRHNLRRAAGADVVVLHRGLLPFSPWQRPTFERALALINPRLVYDFYDAIWLQRQAASRQLSQLGRWLHPADKIEVVSRLARVVTVSNERLAEWARHVHDDVRVLPMLVEVDGYARRHHAERSPVVLGWFGSARQLNRLMGLAPALRRLAAERDIVLRVVSGEPVDILGVPVDSRTEPWSPESERDDLAAVDIGLLPLEDTPLDRGKSPYKLLQYLASGTAVVATPVGMDLDVLEPERCFLPAWSEDDWLEAMRRLVDDVDLRARLGETGRRAVERHYAFGAYAEKFAEVLRTAAMVG